MSWSSSTRRQRLPADWPRIRNHILKRDNRMCQAVLDDGTICYEPANEVDHIRAGDDHSDANLRAICTACHRTKSSGEGGAAKAAARRKINGRYRRTESHPGII